MKKSRMSYKLVVNSSNPPADALIVANIINSECKKKVEVEWCKNWKDKEDLKFFNESRTLIGKRNNEVGRYFARTSNVNLYGGTDACNKTEVDHWLSFAIGPLKHTANNKKELSYLDHTLVTTTWLVAKKLTLADIYVFSVLLEKQFLEKYEKQYPNVTRWYKQILSLPVVEHTLSDISKNRINTHNAMEPRKKLAGKSTETKKEQGKFVDLPGAKMGEVVVRFPPEASGYLHIGHAKAALLNQYYAETFQGQLIMRFDDTNPAKETVEFEQAILEDLELLETKPNKFTHSSDYFDLILEHCTKLIKEGKAFVDDTSAEVMKQQRDQRLKSANRDNSVEKNMELWNEMQKGTAKGQECCVRAKIDYESANGCMRDPTIYRCKLEPHPRTGTKYKVYPTYDFACPIVDSVENVTHTLRTTEYHDRDAQFYWFIDALGLRRPYIWEYSRLNMTNTVLSKRKLTWFVSEGLVDGWDDPRFPTVRGILRRGMTVQGLKQFIIAQGSSKSVVFMEWDKIWAFNKKVIDSTAHRYTALDFDKLVLVNIADAKEDWITVQNHPKDTSKGTKQIRIGPKVFVEAVDAQMLVEGQNTTFINWGNIFIEKIHKDKDIVQRIDAKLNLINKDYKNTLKITWLAAPLDNQKSDIHENNFVPCYAVYFNHIISKPVLGKDDDFKDFVAKDTRIEVRMIGETELKRVKKGEIIQLQRKGFFRCDVPYAPISPFSFREQPMILFHIPDGHATSSNINVITNTADAISVSTKSNKNQKETVESINEKIITQGNKVRSLKAEKAAKKVIDAEIKVLLALKAEYKNIVHKDWTQQIDNKTQIVQEKTQARNADEVSMEIQKQGDKVRQLKSSKTDKSVIDQEVKILLSLKSQYKRSNKGVEQSNKGTNKTAETKSGGNKDVDGTKTGTRLGLEVKKEENFFDWYSQIITKSGMIEYYDVSGCYILRPWSFAIWKIIKEYIDNTITKLGVQECYFPIFVTHSVLEKEKSHIADFAPEVAWVTKCGDSDLAEPIAIRPTSETVMYPAYAKWLRSDTELPLKLNQWNNVVRWEFKDPKPFLRTREFLWQEGHTAFATKEEADEEVLTILDMYARVYEDLLAIPVVKGRKTEKEKFAGGDYTTTVEAFISTSGRAIQGATSHHLGQNFSKMFNIVVEGIDGEEKTYVYQNSWGLTTRTIGVMIMVHGDDKGLVLPPNVASIQAILVPCGITANASTEQRDLLHSKCVELMSELKKDGEIRVKADYRTNRTPGWKFNHWELKGIPVRIELGPKDLEKKQVTLVRRDTFERITTDRTKVLDVLHKLLKDIQSSMFAKAKKTLDDHIKQVEKWDNFCSELNKKNLLLSPFCGSPSCEDNIKADSARVDAGEELGTLSMGAKSLCIPFDQPQTISLDKLKCIHPNCQNRPMFYTLFGRSY